MKEWQHNLLAQSGGVEVSVSSKAMAPSASSLLDRESAYLEEIMLYTSGGETSPLDDELSMSSTDHPFVSDECDSPSSRSDSRSSASSFDDFPKQFQPLITQEDVFVFSAAAERIASPDNLQMLSHASHKRHSAFSPTPTFPREIIFQSAPQDVNFIDSLYEIYPDYVDDRPNRKRRNMGDGSTSFGPTFSSSSSSYGYSKNQGGIGQMGQGQNAMLRRHSSSSDSQSVEEKRAILNVLERVRREDLKSSFHRLRDSLPDLAGNSRAPKGLILKRASEYITTLKTESESIDAQLQALREENARLTGNPVSTQEGATFEQEQQEKALLEQEQDRLEQEAITN